MRILAVNAGSSSLKLRLLGDRDELRGAADLEVANGGPEAGALTSALHELGDADVVVHRVVHGGTHYREAVRIDESVVAELTELAELAPLHQPKSLAAVGAVSEALPALPAIACFDTAFHAAMPRPAATYALPRQWRDRWQLRRYGFHGLSHAYASRRAAEMLESPSAPLRLVTCHLGAGASVTAVLGGRSVDTTMGFTPLEGLVMSTRSGSVDPGLLMWLIEHERMPAAELAEVLENDSGLLGLTGSADMRDVVTRSEAGDADACLGLDVYIRSLRAAIAAMSAAMNGLDALVFTGGVGENSPVVRAAAAEGLRFLGVQLDAEANVRAAPDCLVAAAGASVPTFVVAAREDLEMASQARVLLERA